MLLVGPEHFQLFARPQLVAPFTQLVGGTRRHVDAFVELPIAGLNQRLMQVPLGKVAGEMVGRQSRRQRARFRDRSVAILPSRFVGNGRGSVGRGHSTTKAGNDAQRTDGDTKQVHVEVPAETGLPEKCGGTQ
ncbi:hypothetical protein ABIB95_000038 [Bradyrhizobium sp. LA2.1]